MATDAERLQIEQIGYHVVGSAIRVHRELGPGLLESTYQACLVSELQETGYCVDTEVVLPIEYKGRYVEAGYRIDLIVDKKVVVENKAVERLLPIHTALGESTLITKARTRSGIFSSVLPGVRCSMASARLLLILLASIRSL